MINYSEQKYASSTIEVKYVEGPDNGPPMVLIHGLGARWAAWDPVIDQFAEKWHVYAVDLRGHGDSGRVPDSYAFVDYPTEIMEFLRDVVGQPAFLVSHSLGAVTATRTPAAYRAAGLPLQGRSPLRGDKVNPPPPWGCDSRQGSHTINDLVTMLAIQYIYAVPIWGQSMVR